MLDDTHYRTLTTYTIYKHVCVCTHTHTHTHTHTPTHLDTHTHTLTHSRTHAHTHTHTQDPNDQYYADGFMTLTCILLLTHRTRMTNTMRTALVASVSVAENLSPR